MAEGSQGASIAKDFLLEIVTPESQLVSTRVDAVRAPGISGEIGVLPSHTRMITSLGVGILRYREAGSDDWEDLAVSSGLVEVLPDRVIVLAQTAEVSQSVDLNRAEAALQRARQRLEQPGDETDVERALEALRRATVRVQAARGDSADH